MGAAPAFFRSLHRNMNEKKSNKQKKNTTFKVRSYTYTFFDHPWDRGGVEKINMYFYINPWPFVVAAAVVVFLVVLAGVGWS